MTKLFYCRSKISMHVNQKKLGGTPWPGAIPKRGCPFGTPPRCGSRSVWAGRSSQMYEKTRQLLHGPRVAGRLRCVWLMEAPGPQVGRCWWDWTACSSGVEPRPSNATRLGRRTEPAPRAWEPWPVASVSGPCGRTCSSCGFVACALCVPVDCSDVCEKVFCDSCALVEAWGPEQT